MNLKKAQDWEKKAHSHSLVALRCITHVLPLSCEDEMTLRLISGKKFHQRWNLDEWNDHIIQPARDAVVSYYQVCMAKISSTQCSRSSPVYPQRYAEPPDVERYMRKNNLS